MASCKLGKPTLSVSKLPGYDIKSQTSYLPFFLFFLFLPSFFPSLSFFLCTSFLTNRYLGRLGSTRTAGWTSQPLMPSYRRIWRSCWVLRAGLGTMEIGWLMRVEAPLICRASLSLLSLRREAWWMSSDNPIPTESLSSLVDGCCMYVPFFFFFFSFSFSCSSYPHHVFKWHAYLSSCVTF